MYLICSYFVIFKIPASDSTPVESNTPQSAIKIENPPTKSVAEMKPELGVSAETKTDDKPRNLQLAWDHINDDKAWTVASEKTSVLTEQFGISCSEDLSFLTKKEIEDLMGKLKTVPARKFENYMSYSL